MAAAEVIIGGYRLLRRLGVGGMAEAFEAEPVDGTRSPKRVCIKRLLPAQAEDPTIREAFHREARLLERLDHSKIVRVLDHFGEEGSECMVLELVHGVDLRALLAHEGRGLSPDEVQILAVDLLRALDHAHTPRGEHEGIVHRDVSPSNVLISADGEARLTDFGIAKELEGALAAASTGIKGKIPYMAPEQMRGETTSAQTDLFSLGVVLYEALSGRRPFDGAHDVEIMTKVLAGERAPVGALVSAPAPLVGLIEALLAFDPARRPRSAMEALRSFSALVEAPTARLSLGARALAVKPTLRTYTPLPFVPSERARPEITPPTASLPTTRPHRTTARVSRRRVLAGALGLGALLVVGALVLAHRGGAARPSQLAPTPSPIARKVASPRARPAEPEAAAPVAPEPPAPSAGAPATEPPPAEAPGEGTLRVVVIPWGNVWIDGAPRGRAPRVVKLPAGVHWIGAGIDGIETKRRVSIRAGAKRTVELDLSGR